MKRMIILMLTSIVCWSGCTHAAKPIGTSAPANAAAQAARQDLWRRAGAVPLPAVPQRYDLDIELNPADGTIAGKTTVVYACPAAPPAGRSGLEIVLHKALTMTAVEGAGIVAHVGPVEYDDASRYIIVMDGAPSSGELAIEYHGVLRQDIDAGEKPGEIHNFAVNAHIAPEGVYLSDEAAWYPQVARGDDDTSKEPPQPVAADYRLSIKKIPGFALVAGCDDAPGVADRLVFESTRSLPGLSVAGGPHVVLARQVGRVPVEVHLTKEHEQFASGILDAVERYIGIYEPLLGPFPYGRFTVMENFFSSGFAYPTYTLLGPAVVGMGENGLRPGYLDHEMVHNWWGNGVYVDPRDGNWCESLTSYCTNYYRHVAEGRWDDARKHRRDICNSLSRLSAERDMPLGRFGIDENVSRSIGYQKGEMVWHMLARMIGQENFWHALQSFARERIGTFATFDDIRSFCERSSGQNLEAFFEQWVRQGGAPKVTLVSAQPTPGRRLLVRVKQEDPPMSFDLPLRLAGPGGEFDADVRVEAGDETFPIDLTVDAAPTTVQLDPDFHLLRKIPAEALMPTIVFVTGGGVAIVLPAAEHPTAYDEVSEYYIDRTDGKARRYTTAELTDDVLSGGNLMILGEAVFDPRVAALLARAACPVAFADGQFTAGGQTYDQAADAILVTVHHPDTSGKVITVYYGNNEKALTNSRLLSFYGGNSLIVFREGKPTYREDFEHIQSVPVTEPQ